MPRYATQQYPKYKAMNIWLDEFIENFDAYTFLTLILKKLARQINQLFLTTKFILLTSDHETA